MEVLFITRKYPPSVGGMQQLSYHLTQAVGRKAISYVIKWGGSQVWLPLFMVYAFVRAVVLRLTRPVSVVHVGDPVLSPLGVILRWICRRPVVVNAHGLDVIYPNRLYQAVVLPAMKMLDGVICISEGTRRHCLARGIASEIMTVIPVGVQVDDFLVSLNDAARKYWASRWNIHHWPSHLLLFVGRLVPRKGVVFFVSEVLPILAARRDDWVCLIVGDGPERRRVEKVIEEKGLVGRVRMLGLVSDEELRAAYAVADVFVMPNVRVAGDFEGFGIVTLEARAAGLPVVAADVEGVSDSFVSNDDGILVPPGDVEAFVQAIEFLLEQGLTEEERLARRQRIHERYDWSKIADEYLRVFQETLMRYRTL